MFYVAMPLRKKVKRKYNTIRRGISNPDGGIESRVHFQLNISISMGLSSSLCESVCLSSFSLSFFEEQFTSILWLSLSMSFVRFYFSFLVWLSVCLIILCVGLDDVGLAAIHVSVFRKWILSRLFFFFSFTPFHSLVLLFPLYLSCSFDWEWNDLAAKRNEEKQMKSEIEMFSFLFISQSQRAIRNRCLCGVN